MQAKLNKIKQKKNNVQPRTFKIWERSTICLVSETSFIYQLFSRFSRLIKYPFSFHCEIAAVVHTIENSLVTLKSHKFFVSLHGEQKH